MRTATVEKEWAEVRRNGVKTEDWSWTVSFHDNEWALDQHYIKSEADAKLIALLFEAGAFESTEHGGVCFDTAFA